MFTHWPTLYTLSITDTNAPDFWGYKGELAALTAAFFWAVSTTIWSHAGKKLPPIVLNFIKGFIGLVLILITMFILKDNPAQNSTYVITLFIISGILGLGVGDTMYFECINRIGPRLGLLLLFTAPPMTAIIAWVFLNETLTWISWLGIAITMTGIAWVVTERRPNQNFHRHHIIAGVLFGLLAGLMQAVGSVISRAAFHIAKFDDLTPISPLSSAMIRMAAGLIFLLLWLIVRKRIKLLPQQFKLPLSLWGLILLATFLGTFLGIWLQQVAFEATKVGIAQTLLATSPVFILPLAWLYREKISFRAVLGACIALGGIALLMSQ